MDRTNTRLAPEAATDAPASPANPLRADAAAPGSRPAPANDFGPPHTFAEPPLISDCLGAALSERIAETLDESFPAGGRKPRHDGFTPEKTAEFLRTLATTGVVEQAAATVGLSPAAAYAFRNRRQGRAFAKMWDAVLVHRARDRLAAELQSRAIAGCVSVRKRDGEIVGEYHYYDNRLAMALLTRLDRLAEREAPNDAHLRALSEDLEAFTDCLDAGGDADAFVDARRLPEPPAAPTPPVDDCPELTRFARLHRCPDWLGVEPEDIPIEDLDPSQEAEWEPEQVVRAFRSEFMLWIDRMCGDRVPGRGTNLQFDAIRHAMRAARQAGFSEGDTLATDDLDLATLGEWTAGQLARGWASGMLLEVPAETWDALAETEAVHRGWALPGVKE